MVSFLQTRTLGTCERQTTSSVSTSPERSMTLVCGALVLKLFNAWLKAYSRKSRAIELTGNCQEQEAVHLHLKPVPLKSCRIFAHLGAGTGIEDLDNNSTDATRSEKLVNLLDSISSQSSLAGLVSLVKNLLQLLDYRNMKGGRSEIS